MTVRPSILGIFLCVASATLLTTAHAQQTEPRAAIDVAVGKATASGDGIVTAPTWTVEVALARTVSGIGRLGAAVGFRTGSGTGDVCVFDPNDSTRCLDRVSRQLHLMGLAGVGVGDPTGELRLLAGPLLVAGDGAPALGGVLAVDGALGSRAVAFTAGARAGTAYRRGGGRLSSRQLTAGIRIRY